MRRPPIIGVAALVACRFGGPSADPQEYVMFHDAADAASDGASSASSDVTTIQSRENIDSGDDGDAAVSRDTNTEDVPGTPFSGDDGNDAAGIGDASTDDAPIGTTEGSTCSPTVAVCDPVHNMGCNSLEQCDVDLSQTTTPTGICVFPSAADGGSCLSTIFTESCSPGFTCVNADCRGLCFCNADCPTGQCCSDTSGPPGFTLCRPCP